ncbi:MAG: alpha/beta fold hydrolase [Flavobacteriales bacterium]
MSFRVVFIHGFLESPSMWDGVISELALSQGEYQCVYLPGHDEKPMFPNDISIQGYASFLLDQITFEPGCGIALVGHSMGGYIAAALAPLIGDALQEVCFFQSKAGADSPEKKMERQRAIEVAAENRELYIRTMLRSIFHPDTLHLFESECEDLVSKALFLPTETISKSQQVMMTRPDSTHQLSHRNFRVSYFLGRFDRSIPLSSALDEAQTLGADHITVCDAGHVGHIEKKQEAVRFLSEFISRLRD